ncbi:hypothetical protein YSA_09822 [Pseudomonas putida ND6]|uniref:Uncharacterized protein n=1 Tax=Pseudomonas putida ND6 TaxID=231023 RepID=I3V2Y2_PSEPU|nr:hypothetical protein YSA_09822 [Pseudomonas putida ND6]
MGQWGLGGHRSSPRLMRLLTVTLSQTSCLAVNAF